MSVHLLDVNVLIGLMWPAHADHRKVQTWMGQNASHGWATCPITQTAVVRILSNPAFSRDALTIRQALEALTATLKHPTHQFWQDGIAVADAVAPLRSTLVGHRQVTDAYLLGLALHRKGKLATMDRGIVELAGRGTRAAGAVTLL